MSNQRKTFTKEFKLEAIRLMSESDKPSAEKIGGQVT
jgi:transposase-like protein